MIGRARLLPLAFALLGLAAIGCLSAPVAGATTTSVGTVVYGYDDSSHRGSVARTSQRYGAVRVNAWTPRRMPSRQGSAPSDLVLAAKAEVSWVDEAAAMSDDAASYQAGAFGARSNALTRASQAPELNGVRFDGFDRRAGVLIDRKLSVTTFPKSQQQAVRQSEALAAGGYRGRWEVPTTAEAARARRMFGRLGISNIDIAVVPR